MGCSIILSELSNLNSVGKINVTGKEINLEIIVGVDMKFIQLLLRFMGSTGTYAYPLGIAPKQNVGYQ